jgi:hypothetical protein
MYVKIKDSEIAITAYTHGKREGNGDFQKKGGQRERPRRDVKNEERRREIERKRKRER